MKSSKAPLKFLGGLFLILAIVVFVIWFFVWSSAKTPHGYRETDGIISKVISKDVTSSVSGPVSGPEYVYTITITFTAADQSYSFDKNLGNLNIRPASGDKRRVAYNPSNPGNKPSDLTDSSASASISGFIFAMGLVIAVTGLALLLFS